jgi:hypothetical protein
VAVRRWAEDVARQACAALAWEPRGHPPSNVVRPNKPYDVPARALSALRDDEPYRNPRFVQDHEEANSKANPPSVDGGVWVDDDARGGQSRGQPPPQVSAALFDSSAVFGPTTGSKNQGKTGQGGSAANFCRGTATGVPREHQFEKEAKASGGSAQGRQINKEAGAHDHDVRGSDGESDEDSAPPTWVVEADQQAMLTLADNRSFRRTSVSRMAADTRAAEAAPGWTGVGADYAAWLRVLRGNPTNPDSGTGVPGGHERWRPPVGHPPPLPVEGTGGGT